MDAMTPEILAPAGDADSFLAALAAGADAVYCGLKNFSARMEADNFGLAELTSTLPSPILPFLQLDLFRTV